MALQTAEPKPGFSFTELTNDDLKFFSEVRNSAAEFLHDFREFTLAETVDWFEKGTKAKYYIVWLSEQRVGYFRTRVTGESSWEVGADLHVSFRGSGLAKSMYREFATQILASNYVHVCTLRVLRSNSRAISLYKDLGFRTTEETSMDLGMSVEVSSLIHTHIP